MSILAVTAAVILGTTVDDSPNGSASTWATFHPASDGLDADAREIADHVARQSCFPTGEQLVAVTGGPLELCADGDCLPMKIAVRESAADGGDINLLDGRGVLYRLCGLGDKCVIEKGKALPERHLLLRREALELALYSFHDLDDVDHVVVFLPPEEGQRALAGAALSPRRRRRPARSAAEGHAAGAGAHAGHDHRVSGRPVRSRTSRSPTSSSSA